jgi:hypothetical protein
MAERKPTALRPYTKQKGRNTFEVNPKRYAEKGNLRKTDPNVQMQDIKAAASDLPMSREGSPTVTDTETGETTYGRPKDFNKWWNEGYAAGGGISNADGKKFQGVF